ncbi:hypothetical protein SAMN02745116_00518 [Pilibacter termitis]|uniref:Uncharacterized protein n=1 Tax=Pilibacter termitis TaxID=263852 RepID=A0A1T4L369_9ENTE|nr:hypothetical protein SAMN02745116_00518 [Pilibacter termitis]
MLRTLRRGAVETDKEHLPKYRGRHIEVLGQLGILVGLRKFCEVLFFGKEQKRSEEK